jgi:hypothetical protein
MVDGSPVIKLPAGADKPHVVVVQAYKHVGSVIAVDANFMADAEHRKSVTLNAYAPIATKIFGSPAVPLFLKMCFLQSLILSRLLFGTQSWTTLAVGAIKRINTVYMTVVRRIGNAMRFKATDNISDYEARKAINAPSIECLLLRSRLLYLSSLARFGPRVLLGMLAAVVHDQPGSNGVRRMSWATQITNDLRILKGFHSKKLAGMPDPVDSPTEWWMLVTRFPSEWRAIVKGYFVLDSPIGDARKTAQTVPNCIDKMFICYLCVDTPAFVTEKGLQTHCRVKHCSRNPVAEFIDDSLQCPACGVRLHSRVAVLNHASETRQRSKVIRTRCRDVILSGRFPRLSPSILAGLSEKDTLERRQAKKLGKSLAPATVPAKRSGHLERTRRLREFNNQAGQPVMRPIRRLRKKTAVKETALAAVNPALKRRRL